MIFLNIPLDFFDAFFFNYVSLVHYRQIGEYRVSRSFPVSLARSDQPGGSHALCDAADAIVISN